MPVQPPPVTNYPTNRAAPDDDRSLWAKLGRGRVEALGARGWPQPWRFLKSLRVGGGTMAVADGNDGAIVANGALASLIFGNRALTGTSSYGAWYFDGTNFYLANASGNLWQISPNTGVVEPLTAWTSLTGLLQNSWVAFGGAPAHFDPAYSMDMNGRVWLRGAIKNGTATAATLLFTLPAGFRPTKAASFAADSNAAYGMIRIENDGSARIFAGTNTILSLNNIAFDTRA